MNCGSVLPQPFHVTNGVRQGEILLRRLFNVCIYLMQLKCILLPNVDEIL